MSLHNICRISLWSDRTDAIYLLREGIQPHIKGLLRISRTKSNHKTWFHNDHWSFLNSKWNRSYFLTTQTEFSIYVSNLYDTIVWISAIVGSYLTANTLIMCKWYMLLRSLLCIKNITHREKFGFTGTLTEVLPKS